MLQAQGQLKEAQAAFGEYLAISRRFAAQDPSNADWQRGLALACLQLARSEKRTGNYQAARKLYEESLGILIDLVKRAPGFVTCEKVREVVEKELKALREGQAKLRPFPGVSGWLVKQALRILERVRGTGAQR